MLKGRAKLIRSVLEAPACHASEFLNVVGRGVEHVGFDHGVANLLGIQVLSRWTTEGYTVIADAVRIR